MTRAHRVADASRVVVFMDVHNYSIASNALAEHSYSFLQEMYEQLGDLIVEHKGEIVKYMGDAILCVFPAGSENEVVACCLKLRKVFSDLASGRGLPSDKDLNKIIFIFSLHKETRKPGENPMQHSPLLASWLPYRKRCGEIL